MAKRASRSRTAAETEFQNGAADGRSDCRDSIQAALRKKLTVKNGGPEILTHSESLRRTGGIPLPGLCLRYLLCQDALPMGRTLTVSGQFRSSKTALTFEMMRWFIMCGGMGWYNDVERKDSPDMRAAVFRQNESMLDYFEPVTCDTQEQWQGAVSNQFETVRDMSKVWCIPAMSIVDSVAAAKPKSEVEKFLTEKGGAGARGYASIALLNSDWLAQIAHRVSDGPFFLALIQHSTVSPVEGVPGATKTTQKGGNEVAFAKTMAFEMRRVKDRKETDSGGGATIEIACTKNALGPTNRKIQVDTRWWWAPNPVTGKPHQIYIWDWHDASIQLLLSFETAEGRKATWKALREICDLHRAAGRKVWSRALGIPESAPVPWRVAGEILEYDRPDLLMPIYDLFHINTRPLMMPGVDLHDIWNGKVVPTNPAPPLPYPREAYGGADDDE